VDRVTGYAAAAALTTLLALTATSATGHDVATRCDWRGCSHIVCNHTGDRCHRFDGDDDRFVYDRPYGYRSSYRRYGYNSYGYGDGYGYGRYGCGYGDGYYDRYRRGDCEGCDDRPVYGDGDWDA
jgi:hypothetical protein